MSEDRATYLTTPNRETEIMNPLTELDQAAYELEQAKALEGQVRDQRLACEERILALLPPKEEGAVNAKADWYKVTVTGNLTRSLIDERLADVQGAVPSDIYDDVIRYEPKLSVSGLKRCAVQNPEAYRLLCSAIATKPAKATVKVERIERKAA